MPNWCSNRLSVKGNKKDVNAFNKAFIGTRALFAFSQYDTPEGETDYCFNSLYPVPDEVLAIGYSIPNREVKKELAESIEIAFFDPDKWIDGYTWCLSHWGTKWDVYGSVEAIRFADSYVYKFDTAWSPPVLWLDKVMKDWPKLNFELLFVEEGVGFAGLVECENGEVVYDVMFNSGEEGYRDFIMVNFDYDPFEEWEEEES